MSNYKKILAALDFSEPSYVAAQQAVALGNDLGAEVCFCHVIDSRYMDIAATNVVEPFVEQEERLRKVAEDRMSKLIAETSGAEDVQVTICVGVPGDEILEEAERWEADLVVMGTHGRTGIKRAVLGSQSEIVLRACPVPLLVVHTPDEVDSTGGP